jgi:hypothetical protein
MLEGYIWEKGLVQHSSVSVCNNHLHICSKNKATLNTKNSNLLWSFYQMTLVKEHAEEHFHQQ